MRLLILVFILSGCSNIKQQKKIWELEKEVERLETKLESCDYWVKVLEGDVQKM